MTAFIDDFGICPHCGVQDDFEPREEETELGKWEVIFLTCLACNGVVELCD